MMATLQMPWSWVMGAEKRRRGSMSVRRAVVAMSRSGGGLEVLKQDLDRLRQQLASVIEQGEEKVAATLMAANYELVREQMDCGIEGIEQAAVLDVLAQGRLDMGDYQGASCLLQQLSHLMDRPHWDEPLLADRILKHMGAMYAATGKPEEAVKVFERCMSMEEKLFGNDSSQLVDALLGCASAYARQDKLGQSSVLYRRIITVLSESNGPDSELLLLPLHRLGLVLLDDAKHIEADVTLSRATRIVNKLPGRLTRTGCSILAALARAKQLGGENEASARLYGEALSKNVWNEDEPFMVEVRTRYAAVLSVLGRFEEAVEVMEDNLAAVQARTGASGIELIEQLKNVAVAHANCGNLHKCEAVIRRRLQVVTSHYGPSSCHLCPSLEMLATLLLHQGRTQEAEALARTSLQLCDKIYGKSHPLTAPACNCLAGILFTMEMYSESHSLMSRVLQIEETQLGGMSLNAIADTLKRLIAIRHKLGTDTDALMQRLSQVKQMISQEKEQLEKGGDKSLLKALGART